MEMFWIRLMSKTSISMSYGLFLIQPPVQINYDIPMVYLVTLSLFNNFKTSINFRLICLD